MVANLKEASHWTQTLQYMTSNHLPNQTTLNDFGQSTFSETAMEGMGFG